MIGRHQRPQNDGRLLRDSVGRSGKARSQPTFILAPAEKVPPTLDAKKQPRAPWTSQEASDGILRCESLFSSLLCCPRNGCRWVERWWVAMRQTERKNNTLDLNIEKSGRIAIASDSELELRFSSKREFAGWTKQMRLESTRAAGCLRIWDQ